MKMAAGALALLAIGIGAFALMLGMKNSNVETTSAQSAPSTVFNIPSEINIPSLDTTSSPSAPVVVNNPAPRVITIPGQAPVQQAPVQQAPVQQAPVQQAPVNGNGEQAKADAQAAADAQAKADAQKKADDDAAATKAANAQKAQDLKANATALRQQAQQIRIDASLQLPGTAARIAMENQAASLEASATSMEAQAAQLGG
jgi:outer membrane biosynthesis protein TonB